MNFTLFLLTGQISENIDVDNEVEHFRRNSEKILTQELNFANHLGLPAIMIKLKQQNNLNLAHILYNKFIIGCNSQYWITLPMTDPSRLSLLKEEGGEDTLDGKDSLGEDTWEWWNELRTFCHFNKHLYVALEMPDAKNLPSVDELNRWAGEPVKALIIPTWMFLTNQHKQPVLSKAHQDIIQMFMPLDVQYIVTGPIYHGDSYKQYNSYIHFLGKKLYNPNTMADFTKG